MRLIDVDALKKAILDYLEDDNGRLPTFNEITSDETLINILRVVYAMPTVDAIPVEWIENYLECQYPVESPYGTKAYFHDFMKRMIKDWRKENE